MICRSCKKAGDRNAEGDYEHAEMYHGYCYTLDCMCQHRVGPQMEALPGA